jgi:hypothetical protein
MTTSRGVGVPPRTSNCAAAAVCDSNPRNQSRCRAWTHSSTPRRVFPDPPRPPIRYPANVSRDPIHSVRPVNNPARSTNGSTPDRARSNRAGDFTLRPTGMTAASNGTRRVCWLKVTVIAAPAATSADLDVLIPHRPLPRHQPRPLQLFRCPDPLPPRTGRQQVTTQQPY